jgi:hypothetical protein
LGNWLHLRHSFGRRDWLWLRYREWQDGQQGLHRDIINLQGEEGLENSSQVVLVKIAVCQTVQVLWIR